LNEHGHLRSIRRSADALADLDSFIGELWLDEVNWETLTPYREARTHFAQGTLIRNLSVVRRITRLAAGLWRDRSTQKTWLEAAPLLPLGRAKRARRPYPLTWEEQRLFFSELPAHLASMSLFKVNTGTRDWEVCNLQWIWEFKVPEVGSVFVIPDDEVKNAEPRVVVCNDVAQSVIEAQRGKHPTHVFCYARKVASPSPAAVRRRLVKHGVREVSQLPAPRGPQPLGEMGSSGWNHARQRAAARYLAQFGKPCPEGFLNLRVHDLKHTYGRRLRAAGVSFEDRQDLLGHKSNRVTTEYSQAELAELKRLSNLVNERRESSVLLRVVSGDAVQSRKSHVREVARLGKALAST